MDLSVRADAAQEAFDLWKACDVSFGWETCFEGVLSPDPRPLGLVRSWLLSAVRNLARSEDVRTIT